MLRRISFFLPILLSLLFVACSPKTSDLLVAEYGKYNVTLEDFEKAYSKNVGGFENAQKDSIDDYKKFLDLYVKFRMKLRDAEVRGFNNDPDLLSELDDYKRQVGASYVLEREFVEPALKKLYDDRKIEIRASHIMFRSNVDDDNLKNKAQSVLDSILAGADFSDMVQKHSEDTYTKPEGGDIYWITAGEIVPEFERAAYATKVGEIYPHVVKTRFGYHIIKVTDKQPRVFKIQASHILCRETEVTDSTDSASAYYHISEIKKRLDAGEDFAELARTLSEDPGTAPQGGDLGEFQRRRMVKPFDEAAFSLKVGEVSDIIKTRFGYHIIKVTKAFDYPEYADEKENLREMYKRATYEQDKKEFIDSLKKTYKFILNNEVVEKMIFTQDTVRMDNSYWDSEFQKKLGSFQLASINGKNIIVDSLFAFAINERTLQNKIANNKQNMETAVEKYSEQLVLEERALTLDQFDPEFAQLMDDYKNGIYIFKLQEDEVWNRLSVDSIEVQKYYDEHKEKYTFKDRVDFAEILVKSDSLINDIYAKLKEGQDFETLASEFTERTTYKAKGGRYGVMEADASDLTQKAYSLNNAGDFSEPFKTSRGWSIVKLIEKLPARIKTFDEARAEVTSEYQEMMSKKLEDAYIDRLNKLYEPKIHYETLNEAFKNDSK